MDKKLINGINRVVMFLAGILLIVAALLKVQQMLAEPILSKGFWESWLFFVIVTPMELGFGIWLVCGMFRKAAWLLAVMTFLFFAGTTIFKAINGYESCGCFGQIHVNPWITFFAIDIPTLLLLLLFRPIGYKLLPPPWPKADHFFGTAVPTFILLGLVAYVLVAYQPPEKTDNYEVIKVEDWATSGIISDANSLPASQAVEPNEAVAVEQMATETPATGETGAASEQPAAEKWPMLEQIDIGDRLTDGIKVVLMYHYDCPTCAEAIPQYEGYIEQLAGNEQAIEFAFIAVPPYAADADEEPVPAGTPALTGKLSDSKKWLMETPVVTLLMDGAVVKAWQGEAPDIDEIFESLFAH